MDCMVNPQILRVADHTVAVSLSKEIMPRLREPIPMSQGGANQLLRVVAEVVIDTYKFFVKAQTPFVRSPILGSVLLATPVGIPGILNPSRRAHEAYKTSMRPVLYTSALRTTYSRSFSVGTCIAQIQLSPFSRTESVSGHWVYAQSPTDCGPNVIAAVIRFLIGGRRCLVVRFSCERV